MNLHKTLRLLIVEDDFMVRAAIRKRVEDLGHEVAGEALDGRQAVEMTGALRPDAVLMDVEMPGMDGLEATRRIYESCPAPVIMLTAYDEPELVKRAGEFGAGAYLVKMPKAQDLERAVAIAIARFDDMMALRRLNAELRERNEALQAALGEVKRLSGLLPICANCKKIRDDDGYWQDVAVYIRDRSEAEFTHGICPVCVQELYPELSLPSRPR